MCKFSTIEIFILFACIIFTTTALTIENGGYSVLVSFSQNVKAENGKVLVEKFKESLQNSSNIIYDAIGRQFTKVTFKIPNSWDISEWNETFDDSSKIRNIKTDFWIDGASDVVFGKFPFSQQYGGCSTPGHQIIIPTEFFSDANPFPQGTVLAREWLKYRYGVFDENGFVGDTLYPLYYVLPGHEPNEVKITECTNTPVTYNFKETKSGGLCSENDQPLIKRLDSGECSISVDKESLENVTSSLMYFQQDILYMQHVCGKDPSHYHNGVSPNKHNAMCRGKSVWDIVEKSAQFSEEPTSENFTDVEYVYVQESMPKVIVAWENTGNLSFTKGPILNSIKRFIYDLPDGSMFCGFPFSNTLSDDKDYKLRELNSLQDKNNIMANIFSDFVKDSDGDINLAIMKALNILLTESSDSEPEGTIVIITKSSRQPQKSLNQRLSKSKVCIMLLYMGEEILPDEIKSYVIELQKSGVCGSLVELNIADNERDMFTKLFDALETVLPETVDDKMTKTVTTEYLSKETSIKFHVDDDVENITFWVFTDKESENFDLKLNERNEKFTKLRTTAIMALSFSPQQSGNLEFSYLYDTSPFVTQVRILSKAGKYLKGYVFTLDTSEKDSQIQMPIIIYAMIQYGSYPVQNAKVSAKVEKPNGENISLELFDDGRGDPDITLNDGIYSRYFTQFSGEGEYKVTVTVITDDFSSYGQDKTAGYQVCCGSFVNTISSKLPVFSKEFKGAFTARSGRPDDGYKPSRILDLKIHNISDDKIVLKWSAPGEEGDSGIASRYEIKLFCGEENTADCDINELVRVVNMSSPLMYGSKQEVTIQILNSTLNLFVGIITYNERNKRSELSNVVQIYGLTETLEVTTIVTDESSAEESSTGTIIGWTIVSILLVICLMGVITYYFKRKSRRKERRDSEAQQNINTDNRTKTISFNATNPPIKTVPLKRIESFPVMLYTHDQIKDYKDKERNPPLYKTGIPPKPWASLDAVTSLRSVDNGKDTKSLGSSSTVHASDETEMSEIKK